LDERVRGSHVFRHGKVYTREEAELLIGDPNCRCALLPWIESIHGEDDKGEVRFSDADDELKTQLVEKASKLSDNEKNDVVEYVDSGIYDPLNNYLRKGEFKAMYGAEGFSPLNTPDEKEFIDDLIKDLDRAIGKNTLGKNTMLYRGVGPNFAGKIKTGDVLTDKGFQSTSLSKGISDEFGARGYTLHIKAKANQTGVFVDELPEFGLDQQEFLLPRNIQWKITKVDKAKKVIYADIISEGDTDGDEIILNVASTLANDDWIRTARLPKVEQEKRDRVIMYMEEQ